MKNSQYAIGQLNLGVGGGGQYWFFQKLVQTDTSLALARSLFILTPGLLFVWEIFLSKRAQIIWDNVLPKLTLFSFLDTYHLIFSTLIREDIETENLIHIIIPKKQNSWDKREMWSILIYFGFLSYVRKVKAQSN